MSTMKLLQTKEPINNSFTLAFDFVRTGIVFSLNWYICTETCWRSSCNVCTN